MDEKNQRVDLIIDYTLKNLKELVESNTVVGKPMIIDDKTKIIPLNKINLGFVAGGGEVCNDTKANSSTKKIYSKGFPFAGGSGSGFNITPIGFLVFKGDEVNFVSSCIQPMNNVMNLIEKFIDGVGKNEK